MGMTPDEHRLWEKRQKMLDIQHPKDLCANIINKERCEDSRTSTRPTTKDPMMVFTQGIACGMPCEARNSL